MEEEYRDIPNFEGLYQVSNLGNVRSLDRIFTDKNGFDRSIKGRILKQKLSNNGYYSISLSKFNRSKMYNIHQLVAMTFLNHTPNGHKTVINHKNNNPLDNRLINLEITSPRQNSTLDKWRGNYSSKYVGVYLNKRMNKWGSKIYIKPYNVHLGFYENEYDAHLQYQKALKHIDKFTGDNKKFRTILNTIQ